MQMFSWIAWEIHNELFLNFDNVQKIFHFMCFSKDLVMNNDLFSSMMVIDEHEKATKQKNSLYNESFNSNQSFFPIR